MILDGANPRRVAVTNGERPVCPKSLASHIEVPGFRKDPRHLRLRKRGRQPNALGCIMDLHRMTTTNGAGASAHTASTVVIDAAVRGGIGHQPPDRTPQLSSHWIDTHR